MRAFPRILAATDLEVAGQNAVAYAAELAQQLRAELLVLHAFHLPIAHYETDVFLTQEVVEAERQRAEQRCHELLSEIPTLKEVPHRVLVQYGYPADLIRLVIEQSRIRLAVMGSGQLNWAEKLLGSVTSSVIRSGHCSVLAVPGNAHFRPIRKVLFACDFEEIRHSTALNTLKRLARSLDAEIEVLYVSEDFRQVSEQTIREGTALEQRLRDIPHEYAYTIDKNPAVGIVRYAESERADLITLLPRTHSFWESVFRGSTTRDVLFRTHVPLLALHG